jgi:nucleotide-binding universal stress UspA family protein
MNTFKRILAVSRSTKQCNRVVGYAISMAKKYSAQLYVIRVVTDPFFLEGWNLPIASLNDEHKKIMADANMELEKIISREKEKGFAIIKIVKEGNPVEEIMQVIDENKIGLMVMLAHEEGRLEHFLFGRTNDELLRRMPCSILLVKSEPAPDAT